MAEKGSQQNDQVNLLLADFNTRLRDMEEKNRIVKERVLLLGQNMLTSREEADKEIAQVKKESAQVKKDLERMKTIVENLLSETDKFVKKEEIGLIERMLKDFQPLEFARMKDVEEMLGRESIKSIKPLKREEKDVSIR